MRVAIDIRRMGDFGVGTYIRNVVRTLAKLDPVTEYFLIGPPDRFRHIGPIPDNFVPFAFMETRSHIRNLIEFRRVLRRTGTQLVHMPHLFGIPLGVGVPYVVTVHDVLDYVYRVGNNGHRLEHAARMALTRGVLRRAGRILAVSNFTKQDLARFFGLDKNKIEVVYNAIDERFGLGHANDEERRMIAERYQVNYPFLLYAGRISPHKNLVRIIEAFAALKVELAKEGRYPDLKLIIIGDEVSKHPDLRRTMIKAGVQHEVRFLGFVPIDTLRIFYDAAKIFVFPSLYEGFGLPPLEAMAHGTPVVTSNTSSLPEVVGDAAVMVNPENIFEMRNALQRVLLDQELRDQLKQRGYEQVKKFSWERSVQRIRDVYEEVIAEAAAPRRKAKAASVSG